MAQCVTCEKWFHRMCERIPSNVFEKEEEPWVCSECIQKEKEKEKKKRKKKKEREKEEKEKGKTENTNNKLLE